MDMVPLAKKELKELLNKCCMTHDAMWFYNCLQECGIEKTNKINRAAVKAMAAVEIKRLKKAVGVDNLETFGVSFGTSSKSPWQPSRATL